MTLPDGEVRRLMLFAPAELTPQKFIVDSYELHLNGPLETLLPASTHFAPYLSTAHRGIGTKLQVATRGRK